MLIPASINSNKQIKPRDDCSKIVKNIMSKIKRSPVDYLVIRYLCFAAKHLISEKDTMILKPNKIVEQLLILYTLVLRKWMKVNFSMKDGYQ